MTTGTELRACALGAAAMAMFCGLWWLGHPPADAKQRLSGGDGVLVLTALDFVPGSLCSVECPGLERIGLDDNCNVCVDNKCITHGEIMWLLSARDGGMRQWRRE